MNGIYGISSLMFVLFFFAITPNLGFFTLPSLLLLAFIFLLILFKTNRLHNNNFVAESFFILLFYAVFCYGGLYQNTLAIEIGRVFFFFFAAFLFVNHYIFSDRYSIFGISILFYFLLSVLTLITSPKPVVDTFDIFKDAATFLLQGKNPYTAMYSPTYPQIVNHFYYLPFSFVFTTPFTALFHDPRYSILFANIGSAFILKKLVFKSKERSLYLIIPLFLFLPRSFYILEHMYLDPIIFFFFLLYLYLLKKHQRWAVVMLALFLSFKQHLVLLFPLLLLHKRTRIAILSNFFFFLIPFSLILFFIFIDARAFFFYTVVSMLNPVLAPNMVISSPTFMALSILTLIKRANILHGPYPFIVTVVLFVLIYIYTLLKRIPLIMRLVVVLFSFALLTYQSFFNQYYFIGLFLFLEVVREELHLHFVD